MRGDLTVVVTFSENMSFVKRKSARSFSKNRQVVFLLL